MIWTPLALSLLVALGGFIAYYGDLTGRRWGKKRVSWFGLRPKYTAILITSLTGSFTVLLSIVTMLLIVQPVREVVLGGERAIRENKRLNARLSAESAEYQRQLRENQGLLEQQKAQMDNLSERLADTQQTNRKLEAETLTLTRARQELELALQQLQRTYREQSRANEQLTGENRRLARANTQLARSNQGYTENNRQLGEQTVLLTRQITEQEARIRKLREELTGLIASRDELKRETEALNRDIDARAQASDEADRKMRGLMAQIQSLEAQRDELLKVQQELYGLALSGQSYAQTYLALRRGRVILHTGEMLGRRVFKPGGRPEEIRRDLVTLLIEAGRLAQQRGAAPGAKGRAAQVLNKRIVTPAGEQEAGEEASLTAITETLTESDRPTVVTVNVMVNCVEGEPALVDFRISPVRPLFTKGEVVASQVIDARQSPERVADSVLLFLQRNVREAAIQAGAVPQLDAGTGVTHVGALDPKELVALTNRIRQFGGDVLLTALTAEPTTTADPLQLTFKLSRPR